MPYIFFPRMCKAWVVRLFADLKNSYVQIQVLLMSALLVFSFCKRVTRAWIGFRSMAPFYQGGGLISGILPLVQMATRPDYLLLLDNFLQYIILSAGTIMNKHAQFLILKIWSKKVGLMNVYAPNSVSERAYLWLSLSE